MFVPLATALVLSLACQSPAADRGRAEQLARSGRTADAHGLLVAAAVLESLGYRQINSLWGCVGTFQALTGKGGWGPMKRRAFQT